MRSSGLSQRGVGRWMSRRGLRVLRFRFSLYIRVILFRRTRCILGLAGYDGSIGFSMVLSVSWLMSSLTSLSNANRRILYSKVRMRDLRTKAVLLRVHRLAQLLYLVPRTSKNPSHTPVPTSGATSAFSGRSLSFSCSLLLLVWNS